MIFTRIEDYFRSILSNCMIDDFYIDRGPDFVDLFIGKLTDEDLMISRQERVVTYDNTAVKSDIWKFICNKVDEIREKMALNRARAEELDRNIRKRSDEVRELEDMEVEKRKKSIEKVIKEILNVIEEVTKEKGALDQENEMLAKEVKSAVFVSYLVANMIIDLKNASNNDNTAYYTKVSQGGFDEFLNKHIKVSASVPANWRKIVLSVFGKRICHIAGALRKRKDGRKNLKLEWVKLELSDLDIQCALAINNAIRSNRHIIVNGHTVALYLSGGIMAHFRFRKKSPLLKEFQLEETEIFRVIYDKYYNKFNTIYNIQGYQNSAITINTLDEYYVITSEYVLEIALKPAPMLLEGSQSIIRGLSDMASIAKLKDEEDEWQSLWDDD